jgi:hypothetical protein
MAMLDTWFDRAITATSLNEVFAELQLRPYPPVQLLSRPFTADASSPSSAGSSGRHPNPSRQQIIHQSLLEEAKAFSLATQGRYLGFMHCVNFHNALHVFGTPQRNHQLSDRLRTCRKASSQGVVGG